MKYEKHASPLLNYNQAAPEAVKALGAASAYVAKAVEPKLKALIELRVSQINGCAFCVNMHSQEARAAGETQQRLDVLPVWHDTTFFTEAERAALTWAEQVTKLGENPVPDELYAEMKKYYSDKEIVDQTMTAVTMNAWNRMSITFRNRPPHRKENGGTV